MSNLNDTAQHLCLFNTQAYNSLNIRNTTKKYLRLDHVSQGRLIGSICGVVDDDVFYSGWSAPFGGPDFSRPRETVTHIGATIDSVLSDIGSSGIQYVHLKTKPTWYSENEVHLMQGLLARGFEVSSADLSYHFDIQRLFSGKGYAANIRSSARRTLTRSNGEPFDFQRANTSMTAKTAYALIQANRTRRGNPLNLSFDYIQEIQQIFPKKIRWFLLSHSDTPVASALLYRVLPSVELVLYWGDEHSLRFSPMNTLAYCIVSQALSEGVKFVDLGLSSVNGVPDAGLIQFKQSVGAIPSLRLNLSLRL